MIVGGWNFTKEREDRVNLTNGEWSEHEDTQEHDERASWIFEPFWLARGRATGGHPHEHVGGSQGPQRATCELPELSAEVQ